LSSWAIVVDARSSCMGLMADGWFADFDFNFDCLGHAYIIPYVWPLSRAFLVFSSP